MAAASPVAPEVKPEGPRRSWWYRPGEGVVARIAGGLVLLVPVVAVIYGIHHALVSRGAYGDAPWVAKVAPIAASLLAAAAMAALLNRPGLADRVIRVDERHHWLFTLDWHKPTQGKMTRWGTTVGAGALVGWGIYALYLELQSVDNRTQIAVTLGLTVVAAWAIFRLVNMPAFVDFLVGTEAEMNKVSWPGWPELKQATVVVLACVVLMSVFLFGMDQVWALMLQLIGVLRIAPQAIEPQGMFWDGLPVNPFV